MYEIRNKVFLLTYRCCLLVFSWDFCTVFGLLDEKTGRLRKALDCNYEAENGTRSQEMTRRQHR